MKLGTIQTQWIQDLRRFASRQIAGRLGEIDVNGTINACCLGQFLFTAADINGQFPEGTEFPESQNAKHQKITGLSDGGSWYFLRDSYSSFGLRDAYGSTKREVFWNGRSYESLSALNDDGMPWPQMADLIESDPENFFAEAK